MLHWDGEIDDKNSSGLFIFKPTRFGPALGLLFGTFSGPKLNSIQQFGCRAESNETVFFQHYNFAFCLLSGFIFAILYSFAVHNTTTLARQKTFSKNLV